MDIMHSGRGWAKDILFEYWTPMRPAKTAKAVILLDGMPTVPSKKALAEFLVKKGHHVFHMRYRGSWESRGVFLKESPDVDVSILVDTLHKGFTDVYTGKRVVPKYAALIVLGASFGGAAALLASRDVRVTKVVALAPLIDWNIESKVEPLEHLHTLIPEIFGEAYRSAKQHWAKLGKRGFFNPIDHTDEIDGDKVLIIHEKGDRLCPSSASADFAAAIDATYVLMKGDAHFSLSYAMSPVIWKKIRTFIT